MHQVRRLVVEAHRRSLWQVFTVYVAVAWGVYQVIDAMPGLIGIPAWVPGMSVALFLIGLPIVLATAFVQEGGPIGSRGAPLLPATTDLTLLPDIAFDAGAGTDPRGGGPPDGDAGPRVPLVRRLFTWKRSFIGAALALLLLTTSAGGYVGMREMGWGPFASLRASGALAADDVLILADFGNATPDSTVADVITEALRIDLSSSRGLSIAEPAQIEAALERMQRSTSTRIDRDLAHEIAQREQLKAVIAGEVGALGSSYVLTAEIFSAADRSVIASFRETAKNADQLLAATDRLARRIREKAGESLRTVNSSPPLEHVTTQSLPALRKYTAAVRLGGSTESRELLREAIALDSTFAMAYRTLAGYLSNIGQRQAAVDARTAAFRLRDRMTEVERALTEADYYRHVERDYDRALRAYRDALAIDPMLRPALNNASLMLNDMGRFAEAESLAVRGVALPQPASVQFGHLVNAQLALGKLDEAMQTARLWEAVFPEANGQGAALLVALFAGDFASADSIARVIEPGTGDVPLIALSRGQLSRVAAIRERNRARTIQAGGTPGPGGLLVALEDLLHGGDPRATIDWIDAIAAYDEARNLPVLDQPIETTGYAYAVAGDLAKARDYLARAEARLQRETGANPFTWTLPALRARIALAEGRGDEALRYLRQAKPPCDVCIAYEIGEVFDRVGQPDSAIAHFERFLNERRTFEFRFQLARRGIVTLRLAELYDVRGDRAKAAEYYARLVDLWADADPHLQPRAAAAARRLGELSVER